MARCDSTLLKLLAIFHRTISASQICLVRQDFSLFDTVMMESAHTLSTLCQEEQLSSNGGWVCSIVCPQSNDCNSPLRGPGHDSSVGKWMNLTVCPPCGPGSIPGHGGVFQGIFPWLITLCQPVLSQRDRKWPSLPSKAPHNLWVLSRMAEV